MGKHISLIMLALVISCGANAQFLKNLEKALQKADKVMNSISGQKGKAANSNKTGYITYQEEPSFVNNWGSMELVKAIGNADNGAIQVYIRIKTRDGKNYNVAADKVEGPNGEKLVEKKHWTRGNWKLYDAANGIYASPVWVVPVSYTSLSHICVVTYMQDIWADIYNIPIEWQKPAQTTTATNLPVISQRSFGGIKTGMRMQAVPKSMSGVYTEYIKTSYGEDGDQYECCNGKYNGDNVTVRVYDEDGNGTVDAIDVQKAGVKLNGTPIYIGMPVGKLKTVSGIKRLNNGSDYYKYGSYEMYLDENNNVYMITIR